MRTGYRIKSKNPTRSCGELSGTKKRLIGMRAELIKSGVFALSYAEVGTYSSSTVEP